MSVTRRDILRLAAACTATPLASAQAIAQPRLPERGEYLIRAAHVLTMDSKLGNLVDADIHVRDGEIVAVGPALQAAGARVIDARTMIALPGFVDTHVHLWNAFLRGLLRNDTSSFTYFPLTNRAAPFCTPEDAYRSVRLAAAEALASGVTTLHDWSHNVRSPRHADAEAQGLDSLGMRARFSYGTALGFGENQPIPIADVVRLRREWASRSPLLSFGVALRTPSTAGARDNVALPVLHDEVAAAREAGLPLTMHMQTGTVSILEREGLLGADLQLVHPLGFTPAERAAALRARTPFSISPTSELGSMQAGMGYIQFAELVEGGAQIALSIDVSGSTGNADFFSIMRGLFWSHRQRPGMKFILSPQRLLELATIEGARQLGLDRVTGSLTPGKRADLVLFRMADINVGPVMDPVRAVAISGAPSNVDTVMVDGRILREQGRFTALDAAGVVRDAEQSVRRIARLV